MKTLSVPIIATLLGLFTLSGCKDKVFVKRMMNVPIYMSYDDFRNSISFEGPRTIQKPGSIFKKDDYLLIVEENEGIHFINNANPSAPVQTGFLKVLGCTGMAMKGNHLMVNSYIDLVTLDVSSWSNPTVVSRIADIFPQALPAFTESYPIMEIDKEAGVVIGWKVEEAKTEVYNEYPVFTNCPNCFENSFAGNVVIDVNPNGISGSITKFSVINDFLYVMEGFNLHSINISNPESPSANAPIQIWRNVETLFPYEDNLFLGTTTGMLIYSVSIPSQPSFVSEVNHMTACDPVVVQGHLAYVTIRSGVTCGGADVNQLQVIDISNLSSPVLLSTFEMFNPHGLGIDGNLLFICDGTAGLKVFNAQNPLNVGAQLIQQFENIQATDVIPHNQIAILLGTDGLYQYDYSNPEQINLLSTINF